MIFPPPEARTHATPLEGGWGAGEIPRAGSDSVVHSWSRNACVRAVACIHDPSPQQCFAGYPCVVCCWRASVNLETGNGFFLSFRSSCTVRWKPDFIRPSVLSRLRNRGTHFSTALGPAPAGLPLRLLWKKIRSRPRFVSCSEINQTSCAVE